MTFKTVAAALMAAALAAPAAFAQTQVQNSGTASSSNGPVARGTIAVAPPVSYANRWEIFGGLNYMNFTSGRNLNRSNLGGFEVEGTYWLGQHTRYIPEGRFGLSADLRGDYGTTPILANPYNLNRVLVYQHIVMGGLQVRGPKNQFFALGAHAYGGASIGTFSKGTEPAAPSYAVGLYPDHTAPIGAVGVSVDINQSKKWAIRLSPDLILSRFGTDTDTNFAISGGILYRIGKK